MSDIIFQVENAPNINFDVNQEASEVTFEVQNEIIEMEKSERLKNSYTITNENI